MDVLTSSTLLVALAAIVDMTMLLAIVLPSRFRAPGPIIAGILCGTLFNHALAAWAGAAIAGLLGGFWFRLAVALGFFVMAVSIRVPDKLDDSKANAPRHGAFVTTTVAFFAAEMGDKTHVATVALGAPYHALALLAGGTTIGMMIANVPAVYLGDRITMFVPLKAVRTGAAMLFAAIGIWGLVDLLGR